MPFTSATPPDSAALFAALKGRRALITGGLGFVGSNLAHACVAHGAEVTVYDRLDPRSGGNRANIAGLTGTGGGRAVREVTGDIRSAEDVAAVVRGQDYVFHCAAYTSHPDSMKDPFVDVEVNCVGMLNLLEALRKFNPAARLVHLGTSTQTGPMRREVLDEDHPEFPADIYSANKSVSEKYVLIYGRSYGLHATVVRLSNTYGPRSNIRNPDLGFMNYFIGLALQKREIRVFGDGAQRRTVVYIADAVDALLRAAVSERSSGRVYFAVGDQSLSVAEIARTIASTLGGTVRFAEWPSNREAIEVGDARISNQRIRDELGASFPTNLSEGLARTRDYFLPRLTEYL